MYFLNMSEQLYRLIFGLAAALVLPAICFLLGMSWSKLIRGWQDLKFRKWWTTFCLAMPFAAFGMMIRRMSEENFENLRELWSTEPFALVTITAVAVILSVVMILAIVRLWRPHNCDRTVSNL
jgi:hypothetical protein